jgi:hypothetical protein
MRSQYYGLAPGQQCIRAVLVLLGMGTLGMALTAGDILVYVRLCGVAFAFLFFHLASNRPALEDARLSFQHSLMSRLSKGLLLAFETFMLLAICSSIVWANA